MDKKEALCYWIKTLQRKGCFTLSHCVKCTDTHRFYSQSVKKQPVVTKSATLLCLNPTNISMYIPLLLVLTLQISPVWSYRSGLFSDDGYQTRQLISPNHVLEWREQEQLLSKELLDMLGLKKAPRVPHGEQKKSKSSAQFMMDLYRNIELDEEDRYESNINLNLIHYNISAYGMLGRETGNADLIMSFENQETDSTTKFKMKFEFDEVPVTESVSHAELRFYKDAVFMKDETFTLHVYKDVIDDSKSSSTEEVTSVTFLSRHSGWFDVEITSTVQSWLDFPYSNNGLFILITDKNGLTVSSESVGIIDSRGNSDRQAFLIAFFQAPNEVHVRQKRSLSDRDRKNRRAHAKSMAIKQADSINAKKCHREALYINFTDLNWAEWIIAPDGYAAFKCMGQCKFPLNSHMNATNHAIVQTLVSLMEPHRVPSPLCTPTKMGSISVLYFDNKSNVILKKYKNMVVKACGCH